MTSRRVRSTAAVAFASVAATLVSFAAPAGADPLPPAVGDTTVTVTAPENTFEGPQVRIDVVVHGTGPTGTVTFTAGRSPIAGCETVAVTEDRAGCDASLSVGAHSIVARYNGDTFNRPSSGTAAVVVHDRVEAFVKNAYERILGRRGTSAGIAHWIGVFGNGRSNVKVADEFALSAEGRRRLVNTLYLVTLGRPADQSGLAHHVTRYNNGESPESIRASLAASTENWKKVGQNRDSYLRSLYTSYLGRPATDAGVAHWALSLPVNPSAAQRKAVALQIGRTNEATNRAVTVAVAEVCDGKLSPSGTREAPGFGNSYRSTGANPTRLAGYVLAKGCPDRFPAPDPVAQTNR